MPSLLQRLRFQRSTAPPSEFTQEQLSQLEIDVLSGKLGEAAVLPVLKAVAREGRHGVVQSLISRIHSAGLRAERFLSFAVDHSLSVRDLTSAYRYAESLRYDLRLDGEALLRLALVSYLRGSYSLAITQFSEYLQKHPDSAIAHLNLGRCHLRQSSLRDALDCFRKAGGVQSNEQRWLADIVKGDERRPQSNWYGKGTNTLPRLSTRGWRERVLNVKLGFQTRDLTEIDLWINSCHYISDARLFGEADYWQTPDQTESRRAGDCEDFSIWAWVQLMRQGISCRMVLGGLYSDELNHAWVQIYRRGSVGVLECTPSGYNLVIGSRYATEYRPILSLDKTLRWYSHV